MGFKPGAGGVFPNNKYTSPILFFCGGGAGISFVIAQKTTAGRIQVRANPG
jgi:hypothetical protein